jgi:quinol monooxygenase YgiN
MSKFKYLDTTLNDKWDSDEEVKGETILTRKREKEEQMADNSYGSATSETGTTSYQTLPDVQKRTRFALCDEYVNAYTLDIERTRRRRRRRQFYSLCSAEKQPIFRMNIG